MLQLLLLVASVAAINRSRARCSLQRGKEAACDVLSGPVSIWSEAAKLPVPGSRGVWQVWQVWQVWLVLRPVQCAV